MAYSIGSEAHACGGGSGGLATGGPLRSHGGPSRRHRQTVQSSHGEQQRRQARPHPLPRTSSVARHGRPPQKRTNDSKRNPCNCSGYWQLLHHASRIRTDVVLTLLHVVCVGPGQSFRNCYDRAARLKYICCASVVRTLNATRPVHMLTKARPMSSPRRLLPMLVREVRFPLSI